LRIIPSAGVQYTRVHQKGWRERLSGGALLANWYRRSTSDHLSFPLMLKVNKTFQFGESIAVTPEIRGAWVSEVGKRRTRVRMGYVGSTDTTPLYGVDSGRSRSMLGAGVKARFAYNLDAFVDYNLEFRGGFKNHNFMGGVGWSF